MCPVAQIQPAQSHWPVLAADVGNTSIKLAIFDVENNAQTDPVLLERIPTNRQDFELLRQNLQFILKDLTLSGFIYCSVVPEVNAALEASVQPFLGNGSKVIKIPDERLHYPVDPGEYSLKSLGPDRLMNACAARQFYPSQTVIIADFGTATNFEVVDASGKFLGGTIAPGLETFWHVLAQNTSLLSESERKRPDSVIGQNTIACMQAGNSYGYIGLIREILTRMRSELATPVTVIGTGGLAKAFAQLCPVDEPVLLDVIDPLLTLKGLQGLYCDNTTPACQL